MFTCFKTILLSFYMRFKMPITRSIIGRSFNNVEFISAYDGDTIKVNIKDLHPLLGQEISIRIANIDTPEMKGGCEKSKAMAKEAQLVVQELLTEAKKIDLVNCERGKYFRIIADVYADNINVGDLLFVKGLAVRYDGKTKKYDWCK